MARQRPAPHLAGVRQRRPAKSPWLCGGVQRDGFGEAARRSRLGEFVKLARTIQRFQQLIWNTLKHGISNARTEATNTHLRALTKRAYGCHSPEAPIAMAMLTRGGLQLELPDQK